MNEDRSTLLEIEGWEIDQRFPGLDRAGVTFAILDDVTGKELAVIDVHSANGHAGTKDRAREKLLRDIEFLNAADRAHELRA